jgi:hypothetical protein
MKSGAAGSPVLASPLVSVSSPVLVPVSPDELVPPGSPVLASPVLASPVLTSPVLVDPPLDPPPLDPPVVSPVVGATAPELELPPGPLEPSPPVESAGAPPQATSGAAARRKRLA